MAHTPGPWRWMNAETLVGDHGRRPVVLTISPNGLATRATDGRLCILNAEHPNGRLIAAAPEGLELAKAVVEYFGNDEIDPMLTTDIKLRNMARAILAKVGGA